MTQSITPPPSAIDGQRYARHGRRRKTVVPTIASDRRSSPRSRQTDPVSQWAISGLGTIALALEVVDEAGAITREHDPHEGDEERRLDE